MDINVRLNGPLAYEIGTSRLRLQVEDSATIADLLDQLRQRYPQSAPKFNRVVPIVAGQHLSQTAPLSDGQEVALLMPISGG